MINNFRLLLLVVLAGLLVTSGCSENKSAGANESGKIASLLDSFNIYAGKADFNNYFKYYADDAIFIGTDANERWNKADFMVWSKPFFDKGKAWNFTTLQRNIYFDETGSVAWFDELLNTQMKICRGSGVLVKNGNDWKIKQYVLSMTVPNSVHDSILPIKSPEEASIINKLLAK